MSTRLRFMRLVIVTIVTLIWCLVAYMEALIWTDYFVAYRGYAHLDTAVVFSIGQFLYGVLGTLSTVPFWMTANEVSTERS